jgi:Protein of unknown function (DUF2844)
MNLTRTLICSMLVTAFWAPAFAALGGDATSVEADRAKLKGTLHTTPTVDYTVHEIQTAGGMVVHEYVSAEGKVFAVSWRGPGMPNLPQLLGNYSAQLAQARSQPHFNHHQLNVATADVVMQQSAHLHSFFGRAWVPALLPQNFPLNDIN